jgi:hypothetical protein
MIQRFIFLLFSLIFLLALNACYTGGSFIAQNTTNVELSNSNFKIVEQNLEGSASADYLIGASSSLGFISQTFAIIRIGGTAKLYNEAIQDIWRKYEEQHGDRSGKKLALANIHYDTDILNLLVYTKTTLYVHADVIEFEE